MMKQELVDQVTFTGDKLRVRPKQVQDLFAETCDHIVNHLKDIFSKPSVENTDTILMVGGFSDCQMLQNAVQKTFPCKRIIIPEEAGLAVLMGAVIFGHDPSAIKTRVSKFTYGVRTYSNFDPAIHDLNRKVIIDGIEKCQGLFDKHVEIDQEVYVGFASPEKSYFPVSKRSGRMSGKVFASTERNPLYTDGSKFLGKLDTDLSDIPRHRDRELVIKLIYGETELRVEARKKKTGDIVRASLDFL